MTRTRVLPAALILATVPLASCADDRPVKPYPPARTDAAQPPASTRAWMDRLTVRHHYDPATGFIVADEVVALPPVIASAPPIEQAVARGEAEGRTVIAFATADRCAPCQQFKKDALNDPRVVAVLESGRFIVTHVEVDREPDAADRHLGGRGIPVTYALSAGKVTARLPGQKSADELLAWLNER